MDYKVIVTKDAHDDVDEALDYIANRLQNPIAAKNLLDKIEEAYNELTLRDIYWDKYGVGGMALGDLIKAMQNGLPKDNHKEFYEMALIRHTILTIEQILKEGNSLSDIDTELPSCFN